MDIKIPTLNGSTPAMTVNGWIIFQQYLNASLTWNRNWTEYRNGFGSLGSNYWMGNEKVHLLTQAGTTYRLRIEMLFTAYGWMSAEYDQFSIDNESSLYRIHVACYSNGECGDSLNYKPGSIHYQNGMAFTTLDRTNDLSNSTTNNCAIQYKAGWWFNDCYWPLLQSDKPSPILWGTMTPDSVTQTQMMFKESG